MQRYCILVILKILGMHDHSKQMWQYQLQVTLMFIRSKNHYIVKSYLDIGKSLQTWHFGYIGHEWPSPSKLIVSACRKFWYLSTWKENQLYTSPLSSNIAKIMQICYFGYIRHNAWLWPLKMKVLDFRKLWCVYSCKKSNLSLTSFLKFFKDIANLWFQALLAYLAMHNINNSMNL